MFPREKDWASKSIHVQKHYSPPQIEEQEKKKKRKESIHYVALNFYSLTKAVYVINPLTNNNK